MKETRVHDEFVEEVGGQHEEQKAVVDDGECLEEVNGGGLDADVLENLEGDAVASQTHQRH